MVGLEVFTATDWKNSVAKPLVPPLVLLKSLTNRNDPLKFGLLSMLFAPDAPPDDVVGVKESEPTSKYGILVVTFHKFSVPSKS